MSMVDIRPSPISGVYKTYLSGMALIIYESCAMHFSEMNGGEIILC